MIRGQQSTWLLQFGSILIEDLRVLESVRAAAESGRSEFRCGKYDLQPSAQKY
jgi:hypothetical protein